MSPSYTVSGVSWLIWCVRSLMFYTVKLNQLCNGTCSCTFSRCRGWSTVYIVTPEQCSQKAYKWWWSGVFQTVAFKQWFIKLWEVTKQVRCRILAACAMHMSSIMSLYSQASRIAAPTSGSKVRRTSWQHLSSLKPGINSSSCSFSLVRLTDWSSYVAPRLVMHSATNLVQQPEYVHVVCQALESVCSFGYNLCNFQV